MIPAPAQISPGQTAPDTDRAATPVAPATDALAPPAEKALRGRFDEFKKAVSDGKLADLKALLDPELHDRGSRPLRNRPAFAVNRIVTELGKGDWARAKLTGARWQDPIKGIAVLEILIPQDPLERRQSWILRDGQWYLLPPPPKPAGPGDRESIQE